MALLIAAQVTAPHASAVETPAGSGPALSPADPEGDPDHAPVELDGIELFRVRSHTGFPAEQRAAAIAARIRAVARDPAFRADSLRAVESDLGTGIMAGKVRVLIVTDGEARLETADRRLLADAYLTQIRAAIEDYRAARTREALTRSAISLGVATAVLAALLALVVWSWRRLNTALDQRLGRRVRSLGIQSFEILRAERIWSGLRGAFGGVRAIALLLIVFLYLEYALGLFPWTRATANRLLAYVVDPLQSIGHGIVSQIPNIAFLVVLFFVTRYLLKIIRLLFAAVRRGEVVFAGFEREWAEPTYKLLRVGVIVFALVVAYPYVPGSGSDAFKGISIFLGIVLSLGSSSTIANIIAGYMMTYRRAFKVGDRVKIGDAVGDVVEMRLQVTHLKTIKNEEVIVPNSIILNHEVVNYSSLARKEGLILHTTVGIGYEVPWRQVEAMLLEAAKRTRGFKTDPPPFVRQKSLGDFAITYELNVYCDDAQAMNALYTELHRNILDVFNEFGVQIMTPAYEGDPEEPKMVPKERWFAAPARPATGPDRG
jgi:small-conductance mechanosensitive channel